MKRVDERLSSMLQRHLAPGQASNFDEVLLRGKRRKKSRILGGTIVVGLFGVSLGAFLPNFTAKPPPDQVGSAARNGLGELIITMVPASGRAELRSLDRDATSIRQVAGGRPMECCASFSPSGDRFVFAAQGNEAGNLNLYLGSSEDVTLLLDEPGVQTTPAWSPRDDRIAFVWVKNGNADIYMIDADGSNLRQLTSNPLPDVNPSWSPDGKQLVYASNRDGTQDLYILDIDSLTERRLTDTVASEYQPDWSPDGQGILFARSESSSRDDATDIWLLDLATGKEIAITSTPDSEMTPVFSPSGEEIAFSREVDSTTWALFIRSFSKGGERRILGGLHGPVFPEWNPSA